MAEQVLLNNETFLPMQRLEELEPTGDLEDVKPHVESLKINMSSEISLGELSGSLQDKDNEKTTTTTLSDNENEMENITETENVENQEATSESPTTAEETFMYKCVFCDQTLSGKDRPKILQCLHNACENCVQQKIYEQNDENAAAQSGGSANKGFECPVCGYYMDAENLLDNQFLLEVYKTEELSDKLVEIKCSSCSDDAIASSWCVDCSEFICDSCVQAHQRLKITKDHTIKMKEESVQENQTFSSSGPTQLFCSVHPHEKLSLFCILCDKLTCRDCQLTDHRDHKYKFTHEIASDARKTINTMLTDITYKRVLLNSAMKVIDDRQSLITEKKQALVQEITNLVVRLTNSINVRGKQLVARLNEVCDSKQKTLDDKKIALHQLSKITDYCIEFTQNVLDNGSDNALLFSKRHLTNHLQRVKSRRADIPNPEIPVRIHLALDKVPDLIKVISSLGQIIVDGRVYPAQTPSPNTLPPQNSPSPSHLPPQQQQQQQQLQQHQQQPPNYPNNRHLPPYGQQYSNNMSQNNRANMGQMVPQSNRPPGSNMNPNLQNLNQQPGMTMQHNNLNINMNQNNIQNPNQNQMQNSNQNNMQNLNQNNMQSLNQNNLPSMNQGNLQAPQNMNQLGGATMGGIAPMTLAQQLNSNIQGTMQRLQLRGPPGPGFRGMMPNMHGRMHSNGMNSQQQVTSSTHPQGMMHDRSNLRGLLQPNGSGVYVQTGPGQYQAIPPQFAQQYQTRFQGGAPQPYRQPPPLIPHNQQQQQRVPAIAPRPQNQNFQAPSQKSQSQSGSKWHIPQQGNENSPFSQNKSTTMPTLNNNFKIVLKSQNSDGSKSTVAATVTSTIPKTPSPNHLQGSTEKSLDKFCEDSVNDLMATIAKLDSNGVQVLAESRPKTGGSPHVDSSTGDTVSNVPLKSKSSEVMEMGKDDPNEDWCAVCMDGGELVCCDKCPKVFHQFCHIPNLSVEESDTWQCLLCMNFADVPETEALENDLTDRQKKLAERIILELYCQYEISLPFREVIGIENESYHEVIKNPIALDTIRHKLDWTSPERYTSIEQLVKDVRLMFQNAYTFNPVESQVYLDAKTLEKFFDEQLQKWLPKYSHIQYEDGEQEEEEEEENIQPPSKKIKRVISDD